MKKLSEVRVGVIGVGGMGTGHVRRFENGSIKRGRVTAVCDIDPRKMDKFSDSYKKFTDSRELIRSGEVDAVVIATPHYFHTTIGIDAMDNGLHTLSEKPISVHKADAERLIAAGLKVVSIEWLAEKAQSIIGTPSPLPFGEKIVGVVMNRDGSVLDYIRNIEG